jgi:hypothetical protein
MQSSLPAATEAQKWRFVLMKEIGCVCCILRGWHNVPPEIHHLKSGNMRISHDHTVALCQWHHKAWPHEGRSHAWCRKNLGGSLLESPRDLHAEFGSDTELLIIQNAFIAAATGEPHGT